MEKITLDVLMEYISTLATAAALLVLLTEFVTNGLKATFPGVPPRLLALGIGEFLTMLAFLVDARGYGYHVDALYIALALAAGLIVGTGAMAGYDAFVNFLAKFHK